MDRSKVQILHIGGAPSTGAEWLPTSCQSMTVSLTDPPNGYLSFVDIEIESAS
jgi:hypothetical protein